MKKTYDCEIIKNELLNEEIFKLTLKKPTLMNIKPGQFFLLRVSDSGFPLLRRPISVSKVSKDIIEFTIKIVGKGTKLLKDTKKNEKINILGPLGNGFYLDDISKNSIVVGGGIGISPVKELIRVLKKELNEDIPVLLGFRDIPFDIEDYKKMNNNIKIATESGKYGYKGYVTDLLEEELKKNKTDMVYVCGPHIMLKSIVKICNRYDTKVQLLMEEKMACGIGACLVCTCAIKEKGEIKNKRVCTDGPVFYGSEVVFDV